MIAYNRQSLDNLDLQQQAREAYEKQLLTREEYDRIRAAYPYVFYLPDIFIRIGLFILTIIAAAAGLGLFLLAGFGGLSGLSLITYGVIAFVVLELFIYTRKMVGSGVDDALLYFASALIISGLNFTSCAYLTPSNNCTIILALALFGMLRYADRLMTLVAYGAFLCLIFYMVRPLGPIARALLPFGVLGLSIAGYFLFTRLQKMTALRHYGSCLHLLRVAALLSGYAAGNYYVIRELNTMISGTPRPVAFGWLWWLLTALIPIIYIVRGLRKKDFLFLWTGMALVAASIFTVRYYYHLLPAEIVMVIGGIALIAGVYGLTRYLRTPKHGFTAAAPGHPHPLADLPAEGWIVAETFRSVAAQSANGGTHFGGGDTGGGGAGGQY